jgi:hypothetical protein
MDRRMTKTSIHLLVLLMGASLSIAAPAMQFELRPVADASPARAALVMSGKVDGTELRQLKDWMAKQPDIDTIILKNSTGGDAAAGYAVGEYIRDKGLATGVTGHCLSSCSRMFLGGKTRFFTDELPPEKTMVGFHGNYRSDGSLSTERLHTLKRWVMKYMGWNDEQRSKYEFLVDQWVNTGNHHGFMYFFDETKFKTEDGASVIYCTGSEPRQQRLANCQRKRDVSAREIGVIK